MIYLLFNDRCKCFEQVIENFKYIFEKNNIPSIIKHSIDIEEKDTDLWLCIWNDLERLPKRCIIYNMDPMVDGVLNSFTNLVNVSQSNIILFVDYCYSDNINKLKGFCFNYTVVPYGYSSFYEKYSLSSKKDIDILFYGNISSRRENIFNKINDLGYNFIVLSNVFDENIKAELISRSKIILSVSNSDAKIIGTNDLARISPIIINKGFVITEYIGDKTVETKLSLYINYNSSVDELLNSIKYFMVHDEERDKLTENAYKKFKEDFNFEEAIITIINKYKT